MSWFVTYLWKPKGAGSWEVGHDVTNLVPSEWLVENEPGCDEIHPISFTELEGYATIESWEKSLDHWL